MSKKAKFVVNRMAEGTIRVYPEKQEIKLPDVEVKRMKVTLLDYGEGNGFSILPNNKNAQAGTVFKIKDMPLVTLHESKNKFFIRLAFSKATLEDAMRIIKRDTKEWFDFLTQRLAEENAAAEVKVEPKAAKTKTETKTKTKTKTNTSKSKKDE